jgi:hypothetical protein
MLLKQPIPRISRREDERGVLKIPNERKFQANPPDGPVGRVSTAVADRGGNLPQ